jgi:prepilin-type N-terminal cleavage/methylation domain-containing protein
MFITKSKGFSLIELLIGIFIASLVSFSIYSLFDRGSKDFSQISNTSNLQTEATAIYNLIERDLARGGFVHPIRGDITNANNCKDAIPDNHRLFISSDGKGVSTCFDKPSYDGTVAYRYKVTYRLGAIGAGYDANTLYKKVERTDDCTTILTTDTDPDFTSTVHGWQPVSENINDLTFSRPTIGSTNENILNLDMDMQSKNDSDVNLNFRKRIFLRNKPLTNSSTNCDDKCPNSKDIFADYDISSNETNWDPDTRTVPSATVVISENYEDGEDKLQWNTSLASSYGLTVNFQSSTGILSINGSATAREYESFLRSVNYVNTENDRTARTLYTGVDREFILALGFGSLCDDLIGREVSGIRHFYCYVENTTDGRGAWNKTNLSGNNQLWWGQARLRAENSTYYNLSGYLATITSDAENDYVLDKIRDSGGNPIAAWFGGTDNSGGESVLSNASENNWVWAGGPERNTVFFTDDGNSSNDAYVNWRNNEPNNCCGGMYNNDYDNSSLETNEHYPNAAGEHYTQFSNAISGTGYWNDLFVPGVTYSPFQTIGYVLEFSTNFPSPTISCGNGSESERLACANYFSSYDLVLDDNTYTSSDMLDLCDIDPSDSNLPS